MGTPAIDVTQWKNTTIEVNDHQHNLALVLSRAGSCPLIDVTLSDLDLNTCFTTVPENEAAVQELMPVVYKHSGKMFIIVGRNHVIRALNKKQATLKARLLTSVALKVARIVTTQPEASPPVAPPSFNPPRFVDKRTLGDRVQSPKPFNSARPSHGERPSFGKPSQPKKRFA